VPWEEFGDGWFTLPRWTFVRTPDSAVLTLAVKGETCAIALRSQILTELDAILDVIDAHRGRRTHKHPLLVPSIAGEDVQQLDYAHWATYFDAIQAAISEGRFSKIVAARRCDIRLKRPLDDVEALSGLASEVACTRFAFRGKNASFIGATPETLLSKRGDVLTTHALAGTLRGTSTDAPDSTARVNHFLASHKDSHEHQLVVEGIRRSLTPFSYSVEGAAQPVVRRLRSLMHLETPMTARLRRGVSAADLVAALHPTPAVGGVPMDCAAEWIARHEHTARGWYASPVGWMDASGNATFVVAIRSGVLTPDVAYAYTGAGIVAQSASQSEYEETAFKQVPFLRAVGFVGLAE
jgi:isochorismate synthase